jgi:hypothetical protein
MPRKQSDPNTLYRFCGDGECIPGLPHELTATQAEALGVGETLKAAIERGTYQAAQAAAPAEEKE